MPDDVELDFGHLAALAPAGTRTFCFGEIAGEPELTVLPATKENRQYHNEQSRHARQLLHRYGGRLFDAMSENVERERRERDRQLFPRFVVTGWERVQDSAGHEVPFSQEACARFLQALPDWLFDRLRLF
ncbi:MAG TPA: hypothetical protein VF653_19610, partial [Methylomirabilota bacterium]